MLAQQVMYECGLCHPLAEEHGQKNGGMRLSSENGGNRGHCGAASHHCRTPCNNSSLNGTKENCRRDHLLFKQAIIRRAIILWIVGVLLIEGYFLYKSIGILDGELLRGRGQRQPPFDNDINNFDNPEESRPRVGNHVYEADWVPRDPPPPKKSLLPKKVISVFGPESSGTTFLATTLGVAVGAITKDGGWQYTPAWAFSHTVKDNDGGHRVHRQYHPTGRWTYEKGIGRRAMSSDGEWEIQHLSLPWGWLCEDGEKINVVEALVPEECFRYEIDPHLHPSRAEKLWHATRNKKHGTSTPRHNEKLADIDDENASDMRSNDSGNGSSEKSRFAAMCRDEVQISEENDSWTCGAKCGIVKYNGYALYPQRFFVNITSHIEWYLSRGVDIKVVLSMRDRSVSSRGKLKGHCLLADVARREDEVESLDLRG